MRFFISLGMRMTLIGHVNERPTQDTVMHREIVLTQSVELQLALDSKRGQLSAGGDALLQFSHEVSVP